MKVLHVPYTYFPDPSGGTEVYVRELVGALQAYGVAGAIAAPGSAPAQYGIDGIEVYRYAVGSDGDPLAQAYGEPEASATSAFGEILREASPDVVHFHALTSGVSASMAETARRRGVRVVFTYHTAAASCARGDLLHLGNSHCDGVLSVRRCAECVLRSHGAGPRAGAAIAALPPSIGGSFSVGPARVRTALRTSSLVLTRHEAFRAMAASADRVVAVCEWVRTLLAGNGISGERVVLSRQGVDRRPRTSLRSSAGRSPGLRLLALGRLEPAKGLHIAVEAAAALAERGVTLDVYGVGQGADEYATSLARQAGRAGNVRLLPPVAPDDVPELIAGYDACVVPSQLPETGPLVVLESFAAGVPVVGAAHSGITELVRHGIDGLLVAGADTGEWIRALESLSSDAELLARLRAGVRPPRSMSDVAAEMAAIYSAIASGARAPSPAAATVS